jgi:hypothetical protein
MTAKQVAAPGEEFHLDENPPNDKAAPLPHWISEYRGRSSFARVNVRWLSGNNPNHASLTHQFIYLPCCCNWDLIHIYEHPVSRWLWNWHLGQPWTHWQTSPDQYQRFSSTQP